MEYASAWRLKSIINKYSDHISLPILMEKEEWKDGEDGKDGGMVATDEWETVNKASALWTRPKKDITPEQYEEFYKQISHDFEASLAHPLVDTRFAKVNPKGKAPYWEQFGGGIWATDPIYAGKVLGIHAQIVDWARRYGPGRFAPLGTADAFAAQAFRDVLFREASPPERTVWATALRDGAFTPEFFVAELIRGEGAVTAQPVIRMYLSALGRTTDPGGLAYWTRLRKSGTDLHRLAELL